MLRLFMGTIHNQELGLMFDETVAINKIASAPLTTEKTLFGNIEKR